MKNGNRPTNQAAQILFSAALEAGQHKMFAESDILFSKAVKLNTGRNAAEQASLFVKFADHCWETGRYEKSESLYREALSLYQDFQGSEHIGTALIMRNLADICSKLEKKKEAEELSFR
ncbi:MAG: tetratricopeptide repeat protein, partial [Candidatus Obscuribacterales bacterium]|nr:tetratricopeptide repeat protein [Candidatus Obscuribacterales bacterium]